MTEVVSLDRLGIPQLDRFLQSVPDRASFVLVNEPGIEAAPFLYQAADAHANAGRTVCYLVLSRTPSSVRRAMQEFGFDTGDRLKFIDGFSSLVGAAEDAAYALQDPTDLAALAALLERVAADHPDALLLVDPLSTLVDHVGFAPFRDAFPRIHDAMKRFRISATLFTRWPYEDDVRPLFARFDALVRLRAVEDRVLVSQYFTVERVGWAEQTPARPVLYKAVKPGGVFAYIPKIVVTGPFHAGKTTFIQTLSDTAVSVNRLGTTVALDHGHVTIDGLTADVFGTPGQERFDPILKIISSQALGVVVVVDSTRPDTFERARQMMHQTWKQGLPIVVAANKQDSANALHPDEVKRLLDTPAHVRVVGCTASARDGCIHVLRQLIEQIMGAPEVLA